MSCITKQFLRSIALPTVMLCLLLARASGAETAPQTPKFVPGSWTLVLLPDTQYYSEQYPGLFTLQTRWIAKNKDRYNVRYVLHLGDITNRSSQREWQHARDSMNELDGNVPYAVVCGNHDYNSLVPRRTRLNEYFPLLRFKEWPSFGGALNDDVCNTYHLFTAGGSDWIIIALEWAPR